MDRRRFLKAGAAALVLPYLFQFDNVAKFFTDLDVDKNILLDDVGFAEFQESLMRQISAATQVPYKMLTADYKNSNYTKAVLST
jgi:hypothetical protein